MRGLASSPFPPLSKFVAAHGTMLVTMLALSSAVACKAPGSSPSTGPSSGANGSGSTTTTNNTTNPGNLSTTTPAATTATTQTGNATTTPGLQPVETLGATGTPGTGDLAVGATSGQSLTSLTLGGSGTISAVPSGSLVTGAAGSTNPCATIATCQAVNVDLLAPLTNGGFAGTVNQNVNWLLVGLDRNSLNPSQQSSARNVLILVYDLPTGAVTTPQQATGTLSTLAQINWTPTQPGSGTFNILMRDYDRCVINLSVATCGQFAYIAQYDTRLDGVPFTISPAAQTAAPTTGSAASNPANNLLTSLLTTGLQSLISKLVPAATTP